jgi:hypothetical protein
MKLSTTLRHLITSLECSRLAIVPNTGLLDDAAPLRLGVADALLGSLPREPDNVCDGTGAALVGDAAHRRGDAVHVRRVVPDLHALLLQVGEGAVAVDGDHHVHRHLAVHVGRVRVALRVHQVVLQERVVVLALGGLAVLDHLQGGRLRGLLHFRVVVGGERGGSADLRGRLDRGARLRALQTLQNQFLLCF